MPARPCVPNCACGIHSRAPMTAEHKAAISEGIKAAIEMNRLLGLPVNGQAAKTKCPAGHEYSGVRKDGYRFCRTCKNKWDREYRTRQKVKRERQAA